MVHSYGCVSSSDKVPKAIVGDRIVRGDPSWQSKLGEGKDWIIWLKNMNIVKLRNIKQAKETDRLEPKGEWAGYIFLT